MTILILADDNDASADRMVTELTERAVTVCRINTGWFPAHLSVSAELGSSGWAGQLRTPAHQLDLSDVSAVWFRSPTAFRFPAEWSQVERQHSHNEAKFGLGGVLTSLPALWVNHPGRVADAVYKPSQLAVASALGFPVPHTLITNDAGSVRRFAADTQDTLLAKTLGAPAIIEEGRRKVAFTRRVSRTDLLDLTGVQHTAHQFQHWVPKKRDIRVIAVGDQHWSIAITAGSQQSYLDFRADYEALSDELVDQPPGVFDRINQFLKRFDLRYGAFDFVEDHDGVWWFLECSPGGQYGWLEHHTGAPITAALAQTLIEEGAR